MGEIMAGFHGFMAEISITTDLSTIEISNLTNFADYCRILITDINYCLTLKLEIQNVHVWLT